MVGAFLPITEPYRKSKHYANYQSSLTIVMLTETTSGCQHLQAVKTTFNAKWMEKKITK